MATAVDACNMALMRCGHGQTIAALDEGSTESNICAVWYPACRDVVLRDFAWNFAQRRSVLAELAYTSDETLNGLPGGWAFKYSIPTGMIRAAGVFSHGDRGNTSQTRNEYQILSDGTVSAIYTNMEDAELVFTEQVTDLTKWDAKAVAALTCLLGAEIAASLTVNPNIAGMLRQAYQQALASAAAATLNEGYQTVPTSEFLGAYA